MLIHCESLTTHLETSVLTNFIYLILTVNDRPENHMGFFTKNTNTLNLRSFILVVNPKKYLLLFANDAFNSKSFLMNTVNLQVESYTISGRLCFLLKIVIWKPKSIEHDAIVLNIIGKRENFPEIFMLKVTYFFNNFALI